MIRVNVSSTAADIDDNILAAFMFIFTHSHIIASAYSKYYIVLISVLF